MKYKATQHLFKFLADDIKAAVDAANKVKADKRAVVKAERDAAKAAVKAVRDEYVAFWLSVTVADERCDLHVQAWKAFNKVVKIATKSVKAPVVVPDSVLEFWAKYAPCAAAFQSEVEVAA